MFATKLVAGVVRGELDGVTGLAALAVAPAVGLVEGVAAVGSAAASGVSWLRRRIGLAALAVAERCGVVPVATAAAEEWPEERWTLAPVGEVVPEAPVILPMPEPMPSAAQVTEEAPARVSPFTPDAAECMASLLRVHGSVRAAARAQGIAESTFRSRARKLGVQLPGRRAKG